MADPGLVLAEAHIEGPVQTILDSPMLPHALGDPGSADRRQAAKIVADLVRLAAVVRDGGDDLDDGLQSSPSILAAELRGERRDVVFASLLPATALLVGDDLSVGSAEPPGVPRFEVPADIFPKMRMIIFEGQDVVTAARDNLGGDFFLAAGGVDGQHGVLQVEQLQEPRNSRDFVAFGLGRDLPQNQAGVGAPGLDQVQRQDFGGLVERPPQRLAVDGDVRLRRARRVGMRRCGGLFRRQATRKGGPEGPPF